MEPQIANVMAKGMGMFLIFAGIGFALFIAWIMSVIDVIRNDFTNPSNKTLWIILLLFLAPIATILYQVIGKDQRTQRDTDIIQRKKQPDKEGEWKF
jgi:hypothetical protein